MNISDLKPNERNPRTISDKQLEMLKKSIEAFGDLSGFIYNSRTHRLVGGHQRQKVLDPKTKVVIEKRYPKPTKVGTVAEGYVLHSNGERIKYREVKWDKKTEDAAMIAANKHSGQFDDEMLAPILSELRSVDFDFELMGFDERESRRLVQFMASDKDEIEDVIPEVKKKNHIKQGDIWVLGDHRLMCGDSTDKSAVAQLMNGTIADVCFTSPPYNAGKFEPTGPVLEKFRKENGNALPKMNQKYQNDDDNRDESDYFNLIESTLLNALSYSETAMFNIGLLEGCKRPVMDLLGKYRDKFKEIIYWNKKSSTPHIVQGILTMVVEPIFCFGDFHSRKFPKGSFKGNCSNLVEGSNAGADNIAPDIHSATFPVYLPEWIAQNFTESSILDLFGGSGSTLIACEKTKRKCFMMEIDPHYCQIIIERWQKYSDKKAVRSDGKLYNELVSQPDTKRRKKL